MRSVEYIWLDGTPDNPQLRSKTRFLDIPDEDPVPQWGFDGGSTLQGVVTDSDRTLNPVRVYHDPFGDIDSHLVLCEVMNPDGTPHETNTRQILRETLKSLQGLGEWVGFEQEYTLMDPDGNVPWAWSSRDNPPTEQVYAYCGVGARHVMGRGVGKDHAHMCFAAGMQLAGINAEVMPGQWEYQTAPMDSLFAADNLWMSRYLLLRLAEDRNVAISFDPKPKKGAWNGAGLHTNFSTKGTRSMNGIVVLNKIIENLKTHHKKALKVYGQGIEKRLTGQCETSNSEKFTAGVGDRSASVRIPAQVSEAEKGYLEDRRPCANADPYLVCNHMLTCAKNIDSDLSGYA